jgi:hypothetical protein
VQVAQATIDEPGLIDGEVLGMARVIFASGIET